jgi:hypothetical protein
MNTFTAERPTVCVIGTKRADELRPGDQVHFPGTGLVKRVHDAQYLQPGYRVSYCTDTDTETIYPRGGTLVRWDFPHNKVNWFTTNETKLEVTL